MPTAPTTNIERRTLFHNKHAMRCTFSIDNNDIRACALGWNSDERYPVMDAQLKYLLRLAPRGRIIWH
jgi:hypothetical protein